MYEKSHMTNISECENIVWQTALYMGGKKSCDENSARENIVWRKTPFVKKYETKNFVEKKYVTNNSELCAKDLFDGVFYMTKASVPYMFRD